MQHFVKERYQDTSLCVFHKVVLLFSSRTLIVEHCYKTFGGQSSNLKTMESSKVLVLVMMLVILVDSRHIHPGHKHRSHPAVIEDVPPEYDFENIQMNVKPSRFVPLNNRQFFKNMEPCEEGFSRDYLGICREVWD